MGFTYPFEKVSIMFKHISLFFVVLCLSAFSYVFANDNLKIPSFESTNTKTLVNKTKSNKHEKVQRHDGYQVTDSQGNTFYVDNIKNPKVSVEFNKIQNNSVRKLNTQNIKQEVNIGKICFNRVCN